MKPGSIFFEALVNTIFNVFARAFFLISIIIFHSCTYNSFEEKYPLDCSLTDLEIKIDAVVNADCGFTNGEITVSARGGNSPYLFILDNGKPQSEVKFENLEASNYFVKVIDSNGCERSIEVIIQNNNGLNANIITSDTGCGTNLGTITIQASNGTEPYMYQLADGPLQSSNTFSGLSPGEYSMRVVDAVGCEINFEKKLLSGITYLGSVSSIISTNCAISGCHAGSQSPDFREFSNIQTYASRIKIRTQNRSMPRTGSLTQEEIDQIACWVDDGALDN